MIYRIVGRKAQPLTRTNRPTVGSRPPHAAAIDVIGFPDRVELGLFDSLSEGWAAIHAFRKECKLAQEEIDAARLDSVGQR